MLAYHRTRSCRAMRTEHVVQKTVRVFDITSQATGRQCPKAPQPGLLRLGGCAAMEWSIQQDGRVKILVWCHKK